MTVKEWLGEDNQIGVDIWEKKYRYNNENFDEWLDRISNGDNALRQLILEKKFLFGGRILAYRGLDKKGKKITLNNCYVLPSPEDNIESIFNTARDAAKTFSYGGGVGVDISKLAPRGSRINNAAKETTGAVSFMDLYSLTTSLIGQAGRRGALMLSINCNHPDIEEFIDVKSDLNKITSANISIKITDDFMRAVTNNEEYKLSFTRSETGEAIEKTVNAKELFKKIAQMNWDYAEPGVLFWDRINNWNLMSDDENFNYVSTNPCFTGDMRILTDEGYKNFSSIVDTSVNLINIYGNISVGKIWCSGEKETVKITLADKRTITCTPNHKFMTINGDIREARDLSKSKLMPFTNNNLNLNTNYIKLGFIQGDGNLTRLKSNEHKGVEVNLGEKDCDIRKLFADEKFTIPSDKTIYLQNYKDILTNLQFSSEPLPNRTFPTTYDKWNIIEKASFLQGCYSANGSVIKTSRVAYKTTSQKFAKQLSQTLREDFGIESYITTNKSHSVKFSNGEYICKESYDINIGKYNDIQEFYFRIGFYQEYKKEHLINLLKLRSPKVTSVRPNGIEKVYDFSEPITHWGIVEGVCAHNCGELPLMGGGACLLGSINLSSFVVNRKFDYEQFKNAVFTTTIALNDVLDEAIDLNPLDIQRENARQWRPIGLGIMGLADCLIKLGLKYGSQSAINFCNDLSATMLNSAIECSVYEAKHKGAFPLINLEAMINSKFFVENVNDNIKELMKIYGIRNSQLLACAPTGSISTMLGISGSLEPIFANYYMRRTQSLHGKDVEYKVYTPIVKEYMDENNIINDSDLPDYFITSQEIPYRERIDMQSIWQKNIDNSISSTVNLPNSASLDDVIDLYLYAWEKKLKGITIYRTGCKREGILTFDKQSSEHQTFDSISPINKDELGETYGVNVKRKVACGNLYLNVCRDKDGNLVEMFVNTGKGGICQSNINAISRLISMSLRSGVKVNEIVDQLKSIICPACTKSSSKGDKLSGLSCPDVIARFLLKEYNREEIVIKNPHASCIEECSIEVQNFNSCPDCGANLIYEGGCITCKECGWSKCQ